MHQFKDNLAKITLFSVAVLQCSLSIDFFWKSAAGTIHVWDAQSN